VTGARETSTNFTPWDARLAGTREPWTGTGYLQGLVSRSSSEVSSPLMAKSL
jgi:hypothetical protein